MDEKLHVRQICPGVFLLDENREATGYLVVGRDRACVIDTMMADTDLGAAVCELTDKPAFVINTHGHGDHVFGNVFFDECYMNSKDLPLVQSFLDNPEFIEDVKKNNWKIPEFHDVKEGDVFDLGGKTLEVYELPGHTQGGIVLLLKEDRILFTGDSINHHLWMQLDGCLPFGEFVKKLDRLMFLEDKADKILHGHATDFDDISLMRCVRDGAKEIADGIRDGDEPYTYFGGVVAMHRFKVLPDRHYQQNDHVIIYDPKKL